MKMIRLSSLPEDYQIKFKAVMTQVFGLDKLSFPILENCSIYIQEKNK